MEPPATDSGAYYSQDRRSRSVSSVHEDVLNMSPRLSYHNPQSINLQRRLHKWSSLHLKEMVPHRHSAASTAPTEILTPKSVADLVDEIAILELEVVHLERHLLSLYRTAFDQYLCSSPSNAGEAWISEHFSRDQLDDVKVQIVQQHTQDLTSSQLVEKKHQPLKLERIEESVLNCRHVEHSAINTLAASDCKNEISKCTSGHRSLADHLGASISDHVPEICCKLSEDIVRCISAVYCKLANSQTQDVEQLASPTPSVSSSSTFSPKDPYDSWSPQCHYEATVSPCRFESLKEKNDPYSGMVVIPQIRIDADRFGYASKMLEKFRSLIRCLEKIDPRKMRHEEQLAFWINIHNALVMHAFLAYGLHDNHIKSTYLILKAAYDVGGHSINAHTIRSSILGCQPIRPALWVRALFTPTKRFTMGNGRHPYAFDRPEPLSHFALSTGAYSDPAVRLYTAKGIYQELEQAKTEFVQANVVVGKQIKILLPKILHYYAKDASFELFDVIEMVCKCLPESQRKSIQRCLRRRVDKCVEWLPYKSCFRYIVHRDLAEQ
ncbi:uncharacterized protein [Typha latifolia]|uniref:uncharacterized protein isoform X1 n=2 Tax=Typha latifolia TaxID=4733 RepID=UPI003C2AB9DD